YRTHAGANCASTQGYPYSQDARIYCKSYLDGSSSLVVPDASEYPRLRFWHWFNYANALGWFVDDVEVVTDQPGVSFPESFEAGIGDWAVDFGTWEIGQPTSGPKAAHTGTNCAATVLAGNYANNVDSRLISPPFLVPASGNAA